MTVDPLNSMYLTVAHWKIPMPQVGTEEAEIIQYYCYVFCYSTYSICDVKIKIKA